MIFPNHKHSDTVAIVGFAGTTRHLAPYNNPKIDLWGLNEAYHADWWKGGQTGWFQLHPKWDFMRLNNRNDPKHWDWLREEHPFPIFMFDRFHEVPSSERYPIEDAYDLAHGYLTSTPAYMLALAILMGYRRVEIYGIEMSADSEYVYQKPGFEYLIGVAEGKGIEIYLPKDCSLLRGNLYAYEDLRAADRTHLSLRGTIYREEFKKRQVSVLVQQGRITELEALITDRNWASDTMDPDMVRQIGRYLFARKQELEQEYMKLFEDMAVAEGSSKAVEEMIKWHDSQNIPADRKEVIHEQA